MRDELLASYPVVVRQAVVWGDMDSYRHVNNVVYYSYFDTVVNQYLIEQGALDIQASEVVGLVVETGCQYFAPIAFPDALTAGLRVAKLGNPLVGQRALGLRWRAMSKAAMASMSKSLAQMNKSQDGVRATKRYRPYDVGERKM